MPSGDQMPQFWHRVPAWETPDNRDRADVFPATFPPMGQGRLSSSEKVLLPP